MYTPIHQFVNPYTLSSGIAFFPKWHHSSKFFNRVDYYAAASVRDQLDELVDGGRLEILRGMYADPGVRALDTSSAR